ncbi:MAG: hypothetical protein PHX21_05090 [bacterium]|nr:hypothetical protein [bacterium]
MLLLIQIIFLGIKINPGITLAPSFNLWEGWVGPGINGGLIFKTEIPYEMSINCALSANIENVSSNSDNFSYKSAGINLGLEKYLGNIMLSGGASFEMPFHWQLNNYSLTGVSNFWGYYAEGLYTIRENKDFLVNVGLSYHSYPLLKDFVQVRGDVEMIYKSRKLSLPKFQAIHIDKPSYSWVITEPVGAIVGGIAGICAGAGLGYLLVSNMGGDYFVSEEADEYCFWGAEIGYTVGIPMGISLVGKYVEKENIQKAFKVSLLGSASGMLLADALFFSVLNFHESSFYSDEAVFIFLSLPVMPLIGGIVGYRLGLK